MVHRRSNGRGEQRNARCSGIPRRARQETDRCLNRWHLFLLFKGGKLPPCQGDEEALFAFLFAAALVSLFPLPLFSVLPLCEWSAWCHPDPSNLKWSDAFKEEIISKVLLSKRSFFCFMPPVCIFVLRRGFSALYVTSGAVFLSATGYCDHPLSVLFE